MLSFFPKWFKAVPAWTIKRQNAPSVEYKRAGEIYPPALLMNLLPFLLY